MLSRPSYVNRTGRDQRRRTGAARQRRPNLSKWYGEQARPVSPGEFEFELTLLRGRGSKSVVLDTYVESFEWNDEETALSGNVQLRRFDPEKRSSIPVKRGHLIRCRVRWRGSWYELWAMRCGPPQVTVDPSGVTMSVDLKDDLSRVRHGKRRYVRRKTKRKRHGYFGHAVIREFAAKEGVRIGALVRCTKRLAKIDVTGSFLDLVTEVYEREADHTGRRYVIRMRNGRLEVVNYKRNVMLYRLAAQIRGADITYEPKVEKPVTVLVGKARIGKGSDAKKIRHTEYRRSMVERFGYSKRERDYGRVESIAELRRKVKRDLAKQYKVDTSITVEHQGIPFIRRGDGAQVVIPSEGFERANSFVYCTGARHQVQRGSFTSSFDFNREDPFEADRERREKDAREKARRKRKRGDD